MSSYDEKYEADTLEYFKSKAAEYDLVDEQVYWNLSDKLLWSVMEEIVIQTLPDDITFLDAGGGTGRWSMRILQSYPQSSGLLYDLSDSMSGVAEAKADHLGLSDRFSCMNGRLEDVERRLKGRAFDLIFNFHNVLGFVQDPEIVIGQLASLLKPNGLLVSFVPNKYHAIFFNLFNGELDEAEKPALTGRGRFTPTMPDIHFFTPQGLHDLYTNNNLSIEMLTGFPNFIYPGIAETRLRGSTDFLENLLGDKDAFSRIYRLERGALTDPLIGARGNNLFIAGRTKA